MEFEAGDGSPSSLPIAQFSVVLFGSRYLVAAFQWDTIDSQVGAWVANNP
jgi:hypothetical protein